MAREIDIGLVLGGTVSAGAYTAGVVDFLLEALTAFEAKRTSGDADAPLHRPILKAASGSSGGGICAALLAVAATKRITHMKSPTQAIGSFENPLYNLWTTDSLNVAAFVDSGDLDRADGPADRPLSILNGDILEIVSDLAFVTSNAPTNYPFVADPFAVNLATTNLRGVPYSIPFITDKAAGDPGIDRHGMRMHAEHMRFVWSPTGKTLPATIPLDPAKFPQSISDIPTAPGWRDLRQAAQATSAFPLVFPARRIEKTQRRYNADPGTLGGAIKPDWPANHPRRHIFYAVDAGTVNNEPLELNRAALVGPGGRFAAEAEDIDKVVLLVDPLNGGGLPEPSHQFFDLVGQLLGTLIQESRFKPGELLAAAGESIFTRFLLSPTRLDAAGDPVAQAIASDPLAGFFGFFDPGLRKHDFFLGRWNASRFLSEHFVLPATHAAFTGWSDAGFDVTKTIDDIPVTCRPILPLYGPAAAEPARAAWPSLPDDLFDANLRRETEDRIRKLGQRVAGRGPDDSNIALAIILSEIAPRLSDWIESKVKGAIAQINNAPR